MAAHPHDAVDEGGLAVLGQGHELGRDRAADLSGLRRHRAVLECQALADAGVGTRHLVVVLLQGLLRRMEGVGVLHEELAAAEQAEARPDLVAELHLDLVERQRQLAVGPHLVTHGRGDDLLMRGAEAEVPAVPVLETHELGAVDVPAARLVPQLRGLDGGHQHLLDCRSRPSLRARSARPSRKRALTKRQERVDARGCLADHACAQHEPVGDDLGLGGILFECGHVQRAHTEGGSHRWLPVRCRTTR